MAKKAKLELLQNLKDNDDDSLTSEISRYFEYKVSKDIDLSDWWSKNANNFPHLAKLNEIYSPIPSTSASSEAALSTAGNMMTAKRSSIHPSKLNMLCMVHDNFEVISENGHDYNINKTNI